MTDHPRHSSDVRALLSAFQAKGDLRLLTSAVTETERLLAAPGFDDLDGTTRAFVWSLGAAALTLRGRTSHARPDDLDRAIEWVTNAVTAAPPDDPNLPAAQANLATALTDRYQRDAQPTDLADALALFDAAVPALRATGKRVDIALHSQGTCYHERAATAGVEQVNDLDRAIDLFHEALSDPAPDPDERAGYLNSLGLSLRAKGLALADRTLLADSSDTYRAALELADPGGETRAAATANLAAVLQDRAESDNDVELLREAIGLYRGLLESADDHRHLEITTNMATALVDLYRYSRDTTILDDAIGDLRSSAERIPPGSKRDVVLANLGAALHEMFDNTGRLELLDRAISVQDELLAPPQSREPQRTLNLGISLLARFRRRRVDADLDRAIGLFEETEHNSTSRIERASAFNSHANALSLRFQDNGNPADLSQCIDLRELAIESTPEGSLDRQMYRGNLGVDLLERFDVTHQDEDLQRAVAEQRTAIREVPESSADQPRLLAGLADSLARQASETRRRSDVDETRRVYRLAAAAGRKTLPEQALNATMRWGSWETGQQCWGPAVEAYQFAMAATVELIGRQRGRADKESWLSDARGLPAAAGLAHVRAGDLSGAVTMIEYGRAMLLAEALQQRSQLRSVAL